MKRSRTLLVPERGGPERLSTPSSVRPERAAPGCAVEGRAATSSFDCGSLRAPRSGGPAINYLLCARVLACACLLLGCADPAPRYGEATISAAAPRATLTGTTWGEAAALELAPGCPGYLDAEVPAHVVHVSEPIALRIRASSETGPVALAVAQGDEVRCDSDEGAGHAPSLTFTGPGDYLVYVAALRAPAELPYTLSVTAGGAMTEERAIAATRDVSVTITSEPSGATVRDATGRDAGGQVLGTTPAMFVVPLPEGDAPAERSWTLDLEGHRSTTVTGRLAAGALVLHGQLPLAGPTAVNGSASGPQPIRDYQTASLAVELTDECAITAAEVEVDIQHSFVGDLRVVLHTPWSQEVLLQRHTGGSRRNLRRTWSLSDAPLASLAGRSTRGRWQLVVHDDAGADQGSLERFDLRLTCGSEPGVIATPTIDPTPRTPTPPRHPTPSRHPALPELPNHADIVAVLGRLRPTIAQRCTQGGGSVRVYFALLGSGSVQSVATSGTAPQAAQSCVGQIVRGARFSRFRRNSIDVDYTFDLAAPRPAPPIF